MNMPEQGLKPDYEYLIQNDKVHSSMYTSEQIFDDEMDAIFHHGWVFVGHDSEIPNAGDYVLRQLGVQPVIMTRDKEGGVNVIRNRCAHRANMVCVMRAKIKKCRSAPITAGSMTLPGL
ncbi:MAG: Rieske 2Fe-2S domain-containing protein [Immundisolibacteraceae bacterium]|nr:Rieske 2Fe-2S domain-containing protein [Immundisolibacteraceae bacterium]